MAFNSPKSKLLYLILIATMLSALVWQFAEMGSQPSPSPAPERNSSRQTTMGEKDLEISRLTQPPSESDSDFSILQPKPKPPSPESPLPIETRDTVAGKVTIQRVFGPDGRVVAEEEFLNGKLQTRKQIDGMGSTILETRDTPEGKIKIERTFTLEGQLLEERTFLDGVRVDSP